MATKAGASVVVGAAVVGAAIGSLITAYIYARRRGRNDRSVGRNSTGEMPDSMVQEVFSRNTAFFGEKGQGDIRNAYVVVVGLGGVGSHAAHMLARSGVGTLRIIDFDQVGVAVTRREHTVTRTRDRSL